MPVIKDDWWKVTAISLFSVCVTLVGGWLTVGQHIVSAEQVKEQVQNGPYSKDKKVIEEKLRLIEKIDERTRNLENQTREINGKLDLLIQQGVDSARRGSSDRR